MIHRQTLADIHDPRERAALVAEWRKMQLAYVTGGGRAKLEDPSQRAKVERALELIADAERRAESMQ